MVTQVYFQLMHWEEFTQFTPTIRNVFFKVALTQCKRSDVIQYSENILRSTVRYIQRGRFNARIIGK